MSVVRLPSSIIKIYLVDSLEATLFAQLTLFKRAPVFICLQYKSFENTAQKGEIAHNELFLLFPQYTHLENVLPFSMNLQTLSVWKSVRFVLSKGVNLKVGQNVCLDESEFGSSGVIRLNERKWPHF